MTTPAVSSSTASKKTLKRRNEELEIHRDWVSGGESFCQLQAEVTSQTLADRQALLEDLEFKVEIPPLKGLALKTNLCLPWKKMRIMRRYV